MTSVRALLASALLCAAAGACSGGGASPPERASGTVSSVRPVWRWTAPPPSYVGMPAADDRAIAVTYGRAWLVLLDAGGQPVWTAAHDGVRDVKPLLTESLVVAATETGLAGFDRLTGDLRWTADLGERANTPVLAGGQAVTSTWEGSLAAVGLGHGAVAWRRPLPGAAIGPPSTDGEVVVTSWEAEDLSAAGASAVEAVDGARRWEATLAPGGVSAPAVSGPAGTAVVVAGDSAAHGLALDTGTPRWRTELEGAGSPEVLPVAFPGGDVLVAHRLGGLTLLEGRSGQEKWRASSDGAAVRGGPAGPGPDGRFALPLDDGRVLLAGPDRPSDIVDPPGRVAGVAAGPDRSLLMATRETEGGNELSASSGW
jgi:outer membrane protein assembly factor BamB